MVAEAGAKGVTLAVGFNHRYYPSIAFLKDAVDAGQIGTIDHLRVFGAHDGLHNFRADWQYRAPASGGGAMMDVGIHMTDLARYLVGEITEVYGCATEDVLSVSGSEDNAVAVFRSHKGIPITYQASWTEWRGYKFYVDVYGDRGMVRGYYAPMFNLLVTQPEPGGPRKKVRRFYPEIMVREKLRSWESTALKSFEDEWQDFLRMIRGEPGNNADGMAGLRAVEIAHAVYQSSRSREAVHLPAPETAG
jgi:predicted dehydrogenase